MSEIELSVLPIAISALTRILLILEDNTELCFAKRCIKNAQLCYDMIQSFLGLSCIVLLHGDSAFSADINKERLICLENR